MEELAECNPLDELGAHNLKAYCLALEGVSHFLYVAWRAGYRRSMTLMELELQAEVDKYVTILKLIRSQHGSEHETGGLLAWLFKNVQFAKDLTSEQLNRYVLANRYAELYCRQLSDRYLPDERHREMERELRRFYRKGEPGKINMIGS
jgi:hypothetical protein